MSISVNTLSKEVCQHSLLLLGIINVCFLISGKPGTCEKIGEFQCNNGKCIKKYYICDFHDHCGDNSDESNSDGAFCGRWTFKIQLLKVTF